MITAHPLSNELHDLLVRIAYAAGQDVVAIIEFNAPPTNYEPLAWTTHYHVKRV